MSVGALKNAGYVLAGFLTLAPLRAAGSEFEVATIKPAPEITMEMARSGKIHLGMNVDHQRVDIGGIPLGALIQTAFRVRQSRVTGPDWLNSQRFDILAKIPEDTTEDQVPEMLQALLADRFKLAVHRATKDQPAYMLVVTKGGIKAKEVQPDAEVASLLPASNDSAAPPQTQVATMGGSMIRFTRTPDGGGVISGPEIPQVRLVPSGRGLHLESPNITCTELAALLTGMLDQQVIDMTETSSSYQISIDVALEDLAGAQASPGAAPGEAPMPATPSSNPMGSAVVAAVKQLGLRLESRKVPTEQSLLYLNLTPPCAHLPFRCSKIVSGIHQQCQ